MLESTKVVGRLCLILAATVGSVQIGWAQGGAAALPPLNTGNPTDAAAPELENIGVDEHLDEMLPLDLKFIDDRGQRVRLSDYFGKGKPVVLSMNYSSCPMLCNVQLEGLVLALHNVPLDVGKDFEIVSVSLDPKESYQQAAEAKKKRADAYGRPGTQDGWHFLIGGKQEVEALASALGVRYRYVADQGEFAHPAVFVLASPEGKICRYLYGVSFDPRTVNLSLVEASEGKIGSTLDRVLLFCFHYDETKGRYGPIALNVMKVAAGMYVVVMAVGIGLLVNWERRRRKRLREEEADGSFQGV